MPVSVESKNVLEEMRKAGVDPVVLAGLERELDAKPNADGVVKNGILAQASFNDYRSKKDTEIQNLRNNIKQLANLQGAAGGLEGDLKTQVEAQIAAKKDELTAAGYDINDVNELVTTLLTNPAAINNIDKSTENIQTNRDKEMPNQNPTNQNFVDQKTFVDVLQTSMANLASGGINMNVQIARALREADKLGVELPDEKLNGFADAIVKGLEQNKQPQQIMDEYFDFNTIRANKDKQQRDAELKEAEEKGRREALKEVGVNPRKSLRDKERNPNPILDRQKHERMDSRITDPDKLPKNEKGDVEVFRTRRFDRNQRRYEHTENAIGRYNEVKKDYDDDGLYIGHRNQA